MQASDQTKESLHQKASAAYLQGKFDEALAMWRQVLTTDPENEPAREGVRLCELLTADSAVEVEVQVEPAGEEIEAPIEFDVPDLDAEPADPPVASDQATQIDLGDAPVADPDPANEGELNMIVDGIFGDEGPSAEAPGPAEPEVQGRLGELVLEARSAYDRGDTDAARGVLERIFILDEANPEALQLQERIEAGVPPTNERVDVNDLDAPDHHAPPGAFDLSADAPLGQAAPVDAAPQLEPAEPPVETAPVAETPQEPALDPLAEFDDEIEVDGLSQAPESNPKRIKLPQLDLRSSKTRWIVIGAVIGVFVVVGAGFLFKLRSIEVREDVPPPVARPAEEAKPAATPDPATAVGQESPAATAAAAAAAQDVATLVARGNAAFDSGDYAAAIVAFDAVLKQQPGNLEATERMSTATAKYREQQEVQRQWTSATTLFRDGDYRPALQMFYRLSAEDEQSRIRLDRYKENSWFNMGLMALRSRQCDQAREHFNEALQIDRQDADIETALALCDSCDSGSQTGYQRAANAMPLRGLDD